MDAAYQALRLALVAPSLGGAETLAGRPAIISHAGLTAQQRADAGISDSLVRIAVSWAVIQVASAHTVGL